MPKIKEFIPLSLTRKLIAEKMLKSCLNAPQLTLVREIDAFNLSAIKEQMEKEGHDISYTALLVKAAADALKKYPILNSMLEGNQIKIYEQININVAVDTDHGLFVPVIKNADQKSILEIQNELKNLVEKARANKLTPSDVLGGTFTITNMGMLGIDSFTSILNYPQAAILGVGMSQEKVVLVGDKIIQKKVMKLCLTIDHRIIDGATGAGFLSEIEKSIAKMSTEKKKNDSPREVKE
jgi:pyruvate dehydrogenase E2 component (dihydrolipoamide acetyltransferase)